MKILFTATVFFLCAHTFAQPIITNGDNLPAPGFSAPVTMGVLPGGVGGPGENLIWDFSDLTLVDFGMQTYVDVTSTPFYASWPAANKGFKIVTTAGPTVYFYWVNSATKFEQLATGILSGPGSGSDYSPNMTTILVYPFTYGTSVADTYQKVGYSEDNVQVTYDAYGTLIMPYATYTNVVRIEYQYDSGSDYAFWSVDPLAPLMVFNYDGNEVTAFNAEVTPTALNSAVTTADVKIFPNPASDNLIIELAEAQGQFILYNAQGSMICNLEILQGTQILNLENYSTGLYYYSVHNATGIIASGSVMIQ